MSSLYQEWSSIVSVYVDLVNNQRYSKTRRSFLTTALQSAALLTAGRSNSAETERATDVIALDASHAAAVNRRRRIVMMQDAYGDGHGLPSFSGKWEDWLAYRFDLIDQSENQVDAVWWDMAALDACYPSKVLPPHQNANLQRFRDQGIDCLGELVRQTRRRGLEVFWNQRISEVELDGKQHPLKVQHPDWTIETWWPHGMWNLAAQGVRDLTVSVLRELVENYPLDGIQIDFARHTPVLPPGRQWELREHVTDLVRRVRLALLEVASGRGQPILLAVRVPRSVAGCRVDGFDVEAWAQQNLVDIFTIGTRTIDVDVAGFRAISAGRNIKIQPSWDDHHAMDAYQWKSTELLRGVFTNWWQQGADGLALWNWSNARGEVCRKMGCQPGPTTHETTLLESGSIETLRFKNKIFAVGRRGGFPWSEGYFSRNHDAPLPLDLTDDGSFIQIPIRVGDRLRAHAQKTKSVSLQLILFGATGDDELEARFNGVGLEPIRRDDGHKDNQILSPAPQPPSGSLAQRQVNPNQQLLRLDFAIPPRSCHVGLNEVAVRVNRKTAGESSHQLKLEKVEIHVQYNG